MSTAQIFCSTRRPVEDFLQDIQYKFSTGRLIEQLHTRRPLEGVNIYQTSSSRKIALLDIQQNFYWMSRRTFTERGRLVDQMIWAIIETNTTSIIGVRRKICLSFSNNFRLFISHPKVKLIFFRQRQKNTHKNGMDQLLLCIIFVLLFVKFTARKD